MVLFWELWVVRWRSSRRDGGNILRLDGGGGTVVDGGSLVSGLLGDSLLVVGLELVRGLLGETLAS